MRRSPSLDLYLRLEFCSELDWIEAQLAKLNSMVAQMHLVRQSAFGLPREFLFAFEFQLLDNRLPVNHCLSILFN
jgi:hypothetical protein